MSCELVQADGKWLLTEEAFSIYAPCMYRPTHEKYVGEMEGYLADKAVKVFECRRCGREAGILVLDLGGPAPEILGIAVAENCRKLGIGREMIAQVMRREKLDRIIAQTDDDAVGFYRSCGFNTVREVVRYPDGEAVRYYCTLERRD